jgi:hypothetical protein
MKTAYIVGAGLSYYAGLPLQSDFTKKLLAARDFDEGPSQAMVAHLDKFVHKVFHLPTDAEPSQWPELEDIFTFIDLSANTGHHLGREYSPRDLRRMRRVLIARTIRMLQQSYKKAKRSSDQKWVQIVNFVKKLNVIDSRFISLNWDTSLESIILENHKECQLSYGKSIRPAMFQGETEIETLPAESWPEIQLSKMHGSMNWLYCDNCRRIFWFSPTDTLKVADQIIRKDEWRKIDPEFKSKKARHCCFCGVELGTRIATFSYRKALDFRMFQRSWERADRHLRDSERWVFIGYSLPGADFEFKYLLKRVELARTKRPEIIIVSGGTEEATSRTLKNYQGIFGSRIKDGVTFHRNGLDAVTIRQIT